MIYLATPYTHPDPAVQEARALLAARCAAFLIDKGYQVFSPICHAHGIAQAGGLPGDFAYWQKLALAWLARSDVLAVLETDGTKASRGVQAEIAWAKQAGMPTYQIYNQTDAPAPVEDFILIGRWVSPDQMALAERLVQTWRSRRADSAPYSLDDSSSGGDICGPAKEALEELHGYGLDLD